RRENAAARANHRPELLDRLGKISGGLSQRGKQQVANRMTVDARTLVETVLQQILEMRVAVSERQQAVACVAWWEDAKLLAQSTGASPVVGHRNDAGQRVEVSFAFFRREFRETFKYRGQPCAAAKRHDPARTRDCSVVTRANGSVVASASRRVIVV